MGYAMHDGRRRHHLWIMPFLITLLPVDGLAQDETPVTVKTIVRAESDTAIRNVHGQVGFGKLVHNRTPTPIEDQPVIRMNRDTLYSTAVIDLGRPATVTLPDVGDRYMSLHVINQDHFSYVITEPGAHELTQEGVGTPYAYLIIRTFVDPDDPADVAAVNAIQDTITVEGGGDGPLEVPEWNQEQLRTARGALNTLAKLGFDATNAFGTREEVHPVDHLVGAAAGWGGLPAKNASYEIAAVPRNDGAPHVVTVKDVPVDAFWSVTVYNADGYIDPNPRGVYSYNDVTATPNEDGSFTIHFGGCEDGRVNCLPISQGWNYAVRLYEPRKAILDGTWTFPKIEPTP